MKWHWSLLDLLIEPTLRMKSSSFLLTHALEPALVLLVHELKTLLRLVQCFSPITLLSSWDRLRTAPLRALSPVGLLTAVFCPLELRNKRFAAQKFRLGYEPQRAGDSARFGQLSP